MPVAFSSSSLLALARDLIWPLFFHFWFCALTLFILNYFCLFSGKFVLDHVLWSSGRCPTFLKLWKSLVFWSFIWDMKLDFWWFLLQVGVIKKLTAFMMAIKILIGFLSACLCLNVNQTVDCVYLLLPLFHGQIGGTSFDIHYWACIDENSPL